MGIPLLPTVGFAGGTLFGKSGGWSSPYEGITSGRVDLALQGGIRNLTGMMIPMPNTGHTSKFEWNLMATLNPFDMTEAVGLKGLIWGSLASAALRALGINRRFRQATKKIPLVNKFSL